jgi:hypothetical protein
MTGIIDAERVLDAFLAPDHDQLADRVLEAALADIARTPQRPALRVPWRFPQMSPVLRAGLVAVVILAAIGAGGVFLLGGSGVGPGPSPSPSLTPTPTPMPSPSSSAAAVVATTPGASQVAPGIPGWLARRSEVYPNVVAYPADWSVNSAATRAWQPGDTIGADAWPWADTFVSPDADAIGLLAWEMPAGDALDVNSFEDLKAWAGTFCHDVVASACDTFADQAVPMCLDAGGDACRAAILVPTADAQYAFFLDWTSVMFANAPDRIRVVMVGREDAFPAAARYGGTVQLLTSILSTMSVTPRGS